MKLSRGSLVIAAMMAGIAGANVAPPRSTGPGPKKEPQDDRTTRRMKERAEAKRLREAAKRASAAEE